MTKYSESNLCSFERNLSLNNSCYFLTELKIHTETCTLSNCSICQELNILFEIHRLNCKSAGCNLKNISNQSFEKTYSKHASIQVSVEEPSPISLDLSKEIDLEFKNHQNQDDFSPSSSLGFDLLNFNITNEFNLPASPPKYPINHYSCSYDHLIILPTKRNESKEIQETVDPYKKYKTQEKLERRRMKKLLKEKEKKELKQQKQQGNKPLSGPRKKKSKINDFFNGLEFSECSRIDLNEVSWGRENSISSDISDISDPLFSSMTSSNCNSDTESLLGLNLSSVDIFGDTTKEETVLESNFDNKEFFFASYANQNDILEDVNNNCRNNSKYLVEKSLDEEMKNAVALNDNCLDEDDIIFKFLTESY